MCERCTSLERVIVDLQASEHILSETVAGLEDTTKKQGRTIVALKRELSQTYEADPKSQELRELLDYWKERLGKTDRVKTPLDGDRAKAVRRARRWKFTPEQIRQAVDGCARKPYVGPRGRTANPNAAQRHDDIMLILRDEASIERFIGYALEPLEEVVHRATPGIGVIRLLESVRLINQGLGSPLSDHDLQRWLAKALERTEPEPEPNDPPKPVRTPEQRKLTRSWQEHHFRPDHEHPSDPFEAFLAEVERHGKRVRRNWGQNEARCQCPGHDGDGFNLKVVRAADGRVLLSCKSRGCSAEDVCAAVDWPLRWLFPAGSER